MPTSALTPDFDQLYRDHCDMVHRLALGLTCNPDDAEEITQEAFLRAFRSYHTFREESSFSTWIYRIALNIASDYLKHRAKFPVHALEEAGYSLDEILEPNPPNDPETEYLARQARVKCLHAMTECLPTEQRKVFCLAVTIGLPLKVVADIVESSLASVKTTLHRARQRWFGYMEDRCQLIRKGNPCSCSQWVRFGLAQGWIKKDPSPKAHPAEMEPARKEIDGIRALRDLYHDLYHDSGDQSFAERVREGMKKREWSIFS